MKDLNSMRLIILQKIAFNLDKIYIKQSVIKSGIQTF